MKLMAQAQQLQRPAPGRVCALLRTPAWHLPHLLFRVLPRGAARPPRQPLVPWHVPMGPTGQGRSPFLGGNQGIKEGAGESLLRCHGARAQVGGARGESLMDQCAAQVRGAGSARRARFGCVFVLRP